ncbi:MAG: hypothetical protein ACRC0U_09080, partial [Vibrio sp.]
SRFKQLMVGRISQRNYNDQVGEVMAYVSVINKLTTLACRSESPSVTVTWGWGSYVFTTDLGSNAVRSDC